MNFLKFKKTENIKLRKKRILIVGIGSSGVAAARFLVYRGSLVKIIDKIKKIELINGINDILKYGLNIKVGIHMTSYFLQNCLIIMSPGIFYNKIPAIKYAMRNNIPIIGELELASIFIDKPIIAVTGTNGKTTTVKLIEKMLINSVKRIFLGGNIGVPLINSLYMLKDLEIILVEISSFQLDTIRRFRPKISVLLNIYEDHTDRYYNFSDYINSKFKIFLNQKINDIGVFNFTKRMNDIIYKQVAVLCKKKFFSNKVIKNGAVLFNNSIKIFKNFNLLYKFNLSKCALKGNHNKENIAAAIITSLLVKADSIGIQKTIDTFTTLNHRIEIIRNYNDIEFVNDSKSTNLEATVSALESIKTPIILILGGKPKNKNFKKLLFYLFKIIKIIVVGELRFIIKNELSNFVKKDDLILVETINDAILISVKVAKQGDTVLLSPACSSFDQFKNYEVRGKKFKKIINQLI